MVKFITTALLAISFVAQAQEPETFSAVDSIVSNCYQSAKWDQLIKTGKHAIGKNIDYKKLRQKIGYAYFMKADYYSAATNYQKALSSDEYDIDTRAYLYYCGLNTGNESFARYYASKLPESVNKNLGIKRFKAISQIDFEYNLKINDEPTRSNPTYLRMGLATQLGYRLSLYQFISKYSQNIDKTAIVQPEYYAQASFTVNPNLYVDLAYHFLNYRLNSINYPGNMLFAGLTGKLNRFSAGINGSTLKLQTNNYNQLGIWAGVTLPGRSNIYLKSSGSSLTGSSDNQMIFSQTAGGRLYKTLWAEGSVTLGNLKNYNELNARYLYNSFDPTIFRTGATFFCYIGKRATIIYNYTYDRKQIELSNATYNQHSFSGGIIWKI